MVEGRAEGNLYTRYGLNPTIRSLERKLADLEDAEAALAFGSGMAAEAATFLSHIRTGDQIVCLGDVYGGTFELLGENLPRLGIDTAFLTASEVERLPDVLTERTRIVFFETPTNPTLDVFDIAAITAQAHAVGALVVVDNTFATRLNRLRCPQTAPNHGGRASSTPTRSRNSSPGTKPEQRCTNWATGSASNGGRSATSSNDMKCRCGAGDSPPSRSTTPSSSTTSAGH